MSDIITVRNTKFEIDGKWVRVYDVRNPDHLWSPEVNVILGDGERDSLIRALGGVVPEKPDVNKRDVFMENAGFEDIRKGDRVRRDRNTGSTCMFVEGVASIISSENDVWFTADEAGRAEYILADIDHPDDIITIISRPTPVYTNGTVVFDDDDHAWFNNNGMWHCIDIPSEVPRTTKQLTELYGELRLAKVVLDDV